MDRIEIKSKVVRLKRELNLPTCYGDERTLRMALEKSGFFLFLYPFGRESISGACYRFGEIKIIIVNSSQSIGRQHFTMCHELGHVILEHGNILDINGEMPTSKVEREADLFAVEFLLPEECLFEFINTKKKLDFLDILEISQRFRVSYEYALNRVKELLPKKRVEHLQNNIKVTEWAQKLGYDEKLYLPTEEVYFSNTHYIKLALEALEKEKISVGKFMELMDDIEIDGYGVLRELRGEGEK